MFSISLSLLSQGVYDFHDFHMSNRFVPPNFININFLAVVKTFGKVAEVKAPVHLYTISIFGKIDK